MAEPESILYVPILDKLDYSLIKQTVLVIGAVWLVLEFLFFVIIEIFLLPQLQKLNDPIPIEPDPYGYIFRILNIVDELDNYGFEVYICGFFNGAKLEDIYHRNIASFLAWAAFGKHLHDLLDSEDKVINRLMDEILARHPRIRELNSGFNPNVSHCAFTLEPIPYIHRPLLIYVLNGLNEAFFNFFFLRMTGFQRLRLEGVSYWMKQTKSDKPPMVFFHGISPGWSFYSNIVKLLGRDRTLILIDLDAIKIKSMVFHMPTPEQFVEKTMKILKRHRIEKVSIVGHSFGTICAGWMVTKHPEIVSHLTLIDPVSLLLCFPEVAFAFLYRKPKSIVEWVIYYFASREITIAHALRRHFCWHKNNLFLEDVPHHIGVLVALGTSDEITNAPVVHEYVKLCTQKRNADRSGKASSVISFKGRLASITTSLWSGYSHGQILLSWNKQKELAKVLSMNEEYE